MKNPATTLRVALRTSAGTIAYRLRAATFNITPVGASTAVASINTQDNLSVRRFVDGIGLRAAGLGQPKHRRGDLVHRKRNLPAHVPVDNAARAGR